MDIALTMGGSAISAFFRVLFDRMAKPVFLNLFRKQKYDYQILEKLKWKLLIIQAVIEDAESKQNKNLAVKEWLDELQEVAYQADDLLDQINTEALRFKVETECTCSTNQVRASTDPSNFTIEYRKEIMPKLEEIVLKLEDFEQMIGILGLIKDVPKRNPSRLPSTSLVENDVYGRDADKEKIIEYLHSDVASTENVSVISIVGLGGVGKTTLAQYVYNDARVIQHFDTKAWVCISEEYDPVRITKLLLNEINISISDSKENFNVLQIKLKEGLSNKKFLLVLDDIWNRDYNDWLVLTAPFSGGKEGSKIIVTTRDEKVAVVMGHSHIYHLNPLLEENCWSLFKKHAFKRDDIGNLDLELIGREIVKKCGGLPLAIKTMAGLLRSKETIEEWDEILRSDEWDQPNAQASILPSLRLSYNHLSSHLKRCFACCAVFHKDYQFSKDEVILLWMANDLLEIPRSNKRLEDIGDEFLHELRVRSLLLQSSDGKFFMHDLVNDLAKFVSGRYFLRLEDYCQQNDSLNVVRHFSYIVSPIDVYKKFNPLTSQNFLRTFLPLNFGRDMCTYTRWLSKKFLLDVLPGSKSLRVLSLRGYYISNLPESLAILKQLRFLDLSFTHIKWLPSWICTFYNLQTLLLVHCEYLKEFPEDMGKLINLRYLDIRGVPLTKMPVEIGRLERLQSLSTFIVSKSSGSRIEELGKLCNLHGEITIFGLENVGNCKNASMANMKGKKYIKKLTLQWEGDGNSSQLVKHVLEELRPHSNITHLTIKGYSGTRFSKWIEDPSFCNMTYLCLSNCQHCFCLPAIGQLPSLKHLSLSGLSKILKIGKEICGNHFVARPFPCLEELIIENMEELREWHIPEGGVFSCLEELYIVDCPKLIGKIPMHIFPLRTLRLSGCPGFVNSDGGLTVFDCNSNFSSVCPLRVSDMSELNKLSSSDLYKLLPRLEELQIESCQDFVSLPLNCLPTTLKVLIINGCGKLEMTQTCQVSIDLLSISLANFSVKNFCLNSFLFLRRLHIEQVWNLEELSILQGNQNLSLLQELRLEHLPKLKSLPERMHLLLPSLRYLDLYWCPEIECFPEGGLPSSLEFLYICDCERLWSRRREWGLERLPSLANFEFSGPCEKGAWPSEGTWPPEDLLLPCTLRSLTLEYHHNLKTLNYRVLQQLTCFESLYISQCPQLRSLPEEGMPISLSKLQILGCPLLKQCLEWEKGKDWPKVSHIPCIRVDDEIIP